MRRLALVVVSFASLFILSCSTTDQSRQRTPATAALTKSADIPQVAAQQVSPSWFIESYDKGIITARHDGNVYKANCVETSTYAKDFRNATRFANCTLSVELVGHEVKGFGAEVKSDANGRTIVALNVGERLIFRMSQSKDSGIRDEEFKITSVTRSPR